MNDGDGTKCSEEGDSTDDTLAYDDDECRVHWAHLVMYIACSNFFRITLKETVDDTLTYNDAREVIDIYQEWQEGHILVCNVNDIIVGKCIISCVSFKMMR